MADLNNITTSEYSAAPELSPVEQAAIVLLSIGEEPAAAVLRCLSREELIEVTQVMSRMSGIKVESVKNAMQKFFDDYRQQSGVHGASRSYLKRSLDLALGGEIANTVLNISTATPSVRRWRACSGPRRNGWPNTSPTSTCRCRPCSWPSCRPRWPARSSTRCRRRAATWCC
jgi:hypothetical protein